MEYWLTNTGWIVLCLYSVYFIFSHLADTRQFVLIKVLFCQLTGFDAVPGCEGMCKPPDDTCLYLRIPLIRIHD